MLRLMCDDVAHLLPSPRRCPFTTVLWGGINRYWEEEEEETPLPTLWCKSGTEYAAVRRTVLCYLAATHILLLRSLAATEETLCFSTVKIVRTSRLSFGRQQQGRGHLLYISARIAYSGGRWTRGTHGCSTLWYVVVRKSREWSIEGKQTF